MHAHRMMLEDIEEEDFKLIAIYANLEPYKMAFLLNRYLNLKLMRSRFDVDFNHKDVQAMYALFTYKDLSSYRDYSLVSNKFKGESRKILNAGSLFLEEEVRPLEVNLILQYKKVDFFLKIEENIEDQQVHQLVSQIGRIPQVQAAYKIHVDHLKSKQNLIFE
ncbi:IPExxxVDY family protein [Zunongwangia sp. HGR-M22]|uniref:IPExxxVDY family protein n=1 Tax=Zunongwangia sp. HGR-M22 TaxID=3015168 RepID=UPI0022DD2B50|nr:IPExxxVDY family protein [Zunongwangia sp. HGR-M22]WBL25826.1 IPExxxVDY family protein [Zunongwangia sp. HGR-M22]